MSGRIVERTVKVRIHIAPDGVETMVTNSFEERAADVRYLDRVFDRSCMDNFCIGRDGPLATIDQILKVAAIIRSNSEKASEANA